MHRVGLDLQTLARPPEHAIQDSDDLVILGTTTKPAAYLNLKLLRDILLEEYQITVTPKDCKVVPVND